jgi:hypothetical protein
MNKIQEYQDYARRIHILGAEIDRLRMENKVLDEDARKMRWKYADGLTEEQRQQSFSVIRVLMGVEI